MEEDNVFEYSSSDDSDYNNNNSKNDSGNESDLDLESFASRNGSKMSAIIDQDQKMCNEEIVDMKSTAEPISSPPPISSADEMNNGKEDVYPEGSLRDILVDHPHQIGDYLRAKLPSRQEIMEAVEQIENEGKLWKHCLLRNDLESKLEIHELPTRELLNVLAMLLEIFDIKQLIDFNARQGLFSYVIEDLLDATGVTGTCIDPQPSDYTMHYTKPATKSVGDQIVLLSHNRRNMPDNRTMGVFVWPSGKLENQIVELLRKRSLTALVVIGEPPGGACLTENFKNRVKSAHYQQIVLPVKQVCFLDTATCNYATSAETSRSTVSIYINNDIFPECSTETFIEAFGENMFGSMITSGIPTKSVILQDHVLDGRLPRWIMETSGEVQERVYKVVGEVFRAPAHYDGHVPLYIENIEQLEFWYVANKDHMWPLNIHSENFKSYYDDSINIAERGLGWYRRAERGVAAIPTYIKTIENMEKWLWTYYSQQNAPVGWNRDLNSFISRFEQLFQAHCEEHSVMCSSMGVNYNAAYDAAYDAAVTMPMF
jgi:hypothetical protein